MERRLVFILLGLLAAGGALAEAYTWTDESGVVHYSDRPNPGAKRIELFESKNSRPRPTAQQSGSRSDDNANDAAPPVPFTYQTLEVSEPGPEETLWNIETVLDVSLTVSPALRPGHRVRVYFDGKPQMVSGATFQLQEVYRGVHNLQVEVIDETGKLMIRSRPSRFYVQQNTVF